MKFFRKVSSLNNEPVNYEALVYPVASGEGAGLRGKRWVSEDEFINTTAGPAWKELLDKINAAKSGKKTDLNFKCIDGKYFFESTTVFVIEPL